MKKRLLLSLLALCTAGMSFALSVGEYVYTPQGRFWITGANLNANSAFADFTGWTVVSATAEKTIAENFTLNADGYAAGVNSVVSLDATVGEGMYYTFVPSDANAQYVVSFKMKGAFAVTTRVKTDAISTNLVKVAGNTEGTYTHPSTEGEVIANTAEELTEEWQTFNYAIVGDGTARTYFISFTGMATNVEIADLQIAEAAQVADLRQRDRMVERMEAYKNAYNWSEDVLEEYGVTENLETLKNIGDGDTQVTLDEILATCQEVLADFLKENMDDYLSGNSSNYLGIKESSGNLQKQTKLGDWTCVDRGFWSSGAYPDLGHYQQTNSWANGNPTNAMGVTLQKDLTAGSYVFAIESNAAFRENLKQTWYNDDGMKPAYAVAYVVKIVDGVAADTVQSVVKDLEPVQFTPFIVVAKIEEDGTYEFGLKAYCKEAYQSLKLGSVTYVKDASIWGKNENKYNQKQLAYEANVRTQITTGRDNIEKGKEYIADANYFWGKTELNDSIVKYEPVIAVYEAMSQDDIIATFDEGVYEATTSNENGLLQYEVYQNATRWLIAANRSFVAVNDTLNSIQDAIDNAEGTLAMRVYDAATGKAELQAAIATAKDVQAQMQAVDYSEENAQTVKDAVAALNAAVETFKTTIPASAVVEIASIDFENAAAINEETALYEIAGTNTVMSFSYFSETTPTAATDLPFEKGIDANGEKQLPGVLRVGNGSGTAAIAARDYGTNILKVSMDWWFVRLTGKYTGFDLLDAESNRVAGLYFSPYDGTFASGYDDFALDACDAAPNNNSIGNFFVANTTGDAGSCADNNKTHIECFLDYGEKSMYLVATTPSGSFTSNKVVFGALVPTSFVVKSNYTNYNGRRSWFDNLKLEQITAGETEPFNPAGIEVVEAETVKANKDVMYNLAGQKVSGSFKGIVVKNGKKYVVK